MQRTLVLCLVVLHMSSACSSPAWADELQLLNPDADNTSFLNMQVLLSDDVLTNVEILNEDIPLLERGSGSLSFGIVGVLGAVQPQGFFLDFGSWEFETTVGATNFPVTLIVDRSILDVELTVDTEPGLVGESVLLANQIVSYQVLGRLMLGTEVFPFEVSGVCEPIDAGHQCFMRRDRPGGPSRATHLHLFIDSLTSMDVSPCCLRQGELWWPSNSPAAAVLGPTTEGVTAIVRAEHLFSGVTFVPEPSRAVLAVAALAVLAMAGHNPRHQRRLWRP